MIDEERSKRLRKLKDLDGTQLNRIYSNLFDTDAGQLVLEDMKMRCFAYIPTIGKSDQDTAFNEGKRSVLLMIESRINPFVAEKAKAKDV